MSNSPQPKQLTLKEKAANLQSRWVDMENMRDINIAKRGYEAYKVSRSDALTTTAFTAFFTLATASSIVDFHSAKEMTRTFHTEPRNQVTPISENKKLSALKAETIKSLAPPAITLTSTPESLGNGQYFYPERKIPAQTASTTPEKFNDSVEATLNTKKFMYGILTAFGGAVSLFYLKTAFSDVTRARQYRHDINDVHYRYIDTAKIQPLQPERNFNL